MNKLVVLIKFNRNDIHRQPDNGQRFNRTLGKKEWWDNRCKILQDIVLPSLKRQTFQDFDVLAPFTTDIKTEYAQETMNALHAFGALVFWDDRKIKDFVEPDSFIRKRYSQYDNVILLNLDSDDIYHPKAFEVLMKAPVLAGQVCIFRDGYVYDMITGRCGVYRGNVVPPPFFAFTFTKESMKSEKHWNDYRDAYNLWIEHPTLMKSKVHRDMPVGLFCQIFHGYNVTSNWELFKKKISRELFLEERDRVICEFGFKEL